MVFVVFASILEAASVLAGVRNSAGWARGGVLPFGQTRSARKTRTLGDPGCSALGLSSRSASLDSTASPTCSSPSPRVEGEGAYGHHRPAPPVQSALRSV
jgi:hypothetical protein